MRSGKRLTLDILPAAFFKHNLLLIVEYSLFLEKLSTPSHRRRACVFWDVKTFCILAFCLSTHEQKCIHLCSLFFYTSGARVVLGDEMTHLSSWYFPVFENPKIISLGWRINLVLPQVAHQLSAKKRCTPFVGQNHPLGNYCNDEGSINSRIWGGLADFISHTYCTWNWQRNQLYLLFIIVLQTDLG